ncbi:hypothetical protein [Streptobacillus ratti]|uniref:hypothetical protein n=1 Tax=Streptobacillus ratti TaxID=1720557 RepID=UPI0009331F1A|nr:hypothetical protein [Streptobacillus ratti]
MIFNIKEIINKKLLFLFLLSSITYSIEEKSKIEGEVSFGIDTSSGVDGVESTIRSLPELIDLVRPRVYTDYVKLNYNYRSAMLTSQNVGNISPRSTNYLPQPSYYSGYNYYKPSYSPTERDVKLAIKYLSKNIELRKRLGIKLKENYFGLGIKVDVIGKGLSYDKFLSNNDIDKIKLSLISDNKYINGEINYYIKGESSEKIDLDKTDAEKVLKNKVVDYNFSVNPIPDSKVSVSFDFYGQNKNLDYGPTIRYRSNNIYSSVSVLLNHNESSYNLNNELDKIKYVVPGYNKIEYFKKWTLKSEYNKDDMINADKYDKDYADLSKAEVSGRKGTIRILGYNSGSLYGDSLIRYVSKSIFDEIHSNPYFKNISEIVKIFEKDKKAAITDFWWPAIKYKSTMAEVENKNQFNSIAKKIAKDIYKKLGIDPDRKYSKVGLWTQVQKDFEYLLPGYYKNFDYSNINFDDLGPDYLYDGIRNPQLPDVYRASSATVSYLKGKRNVSSPQPQSSGGNLLPNPKDSDSFLLKKNGFHTFDNDIRDYLIAGLLREHKIDPIQNISKLGTWNIIKDIFWYKRIRDTVHTEFDIIQETIKNPYEVKSLDILRGLYIHQSEKGKNILKYEEELKNIFSEIDLNDNKAKYSPKIRIDLGYFDRINKFGLSFLVNDSVKVDAEKYSYSKKAHHLDIDAIYKKGVLDFSSKVRLSFSENDLIKKKDNKKVNENELKYVYNTIDLNTDTYFGFNIPATKRFNLLLGIRHIGQYGWINPKHILKDDKDVKWNIAKRDKDNNPIGKDKNPIITSQTTEKELVDKEYNKLKGENKTKLKRDIHQTDYIETVESGAVTSMYEMYNIVSPRITMLYRPYDNIIFSTNFELPIGFRNFSPSGLKAMYSGEIKYLIDDSYKDIIFTKENPIKFKTSGNIEGGAVLGNEPGYYFSYKAMADLTFLRGDIKGNDKNIDFNVSLNPLIVNLPIKPRFMISKDDSDISTRVGLEYSKGTEFSTVVGFKYVFKPRKDILGDELKPNVLGILKKRNSNEYSHVNNALSNVAFDDKLEYIITPFLDIKKEEGNFRVNIKADSTKVSGSIEKKEVNSNVSTKNTTFAWNTQKNFPWWHFFSRKVYNYFVDVQTEEKTTSKNEIKTLEHEKYDIDIETEYRQEKGINFNLNLVLGYNDTKLIDIKKETTKIETKSKVIVVESNKNSINDTDIQNNMNNKVDMNENDLLQSLKDFVKKKNADGNEIYVPGKKFYELNYAKITETELKEILSIPNKVSENKSIVENTYLHAKKINVNLNTYLGYNFNATKNVDISLGMRYKLIGKYESTDKIILKDIRLYGSNHYSFENTIIPEVKMTYRLIHNLKARISGELPVYFKNKDYKEVNFNIRTGLEYKW